MWRAVTRSGVVAVGMLFAATGEARDATAEVAAVLDKLNHAWEAGDVSAVDALMAKDKDAIFFGTDAAEHFAGYEPLRASLATQFATYKGTKIQVKSRAVKVSGPVAWVAEVVDFSAKSGAETVVLTGARATTVLEKRKGVWLIVHTHYSVPVAGQAIKY